MKVIEVDFPRETTIRRYRKRMAHSTAGHLASIVFDGDMDEIVRQAALRELTARAPHLATWVTDETNI